MARIGEIDKKGADRIASSLRNVRESMSRIGGRFGPQAGLEFLRFANKILSVEKIIAEELDRVTKEQKRGKRKTIKNNLLEV